MWANLTVLLTEGSEEMAILAFVVVVGPTQQPAPDYLSAFPLFKFRRTRHSLYLPHVRKSTKVPSQLPDSAINS
jgi:hypothetical protein